MRLFAALVSAAVLCVARPALGYVYGTDNGAKWPGPEIPILVQLGASSTPLRDGSVSWNSTVERAMMLWNQQIARAQFSWQEGERIARPAANGVTTISFESEMYGDALGSRTLAVTVMRSSGSRMIEADVAFNSRANWSSYLGPLEDSPDDIHRVALHELGHVLGLEHPNQAGQQVAAIMNSQVSDLDRLQHDDIAGARSLYGTPPNSPPLIRNGRLANISTRGRAGTGDNVMIAGFVVTDAPKRVLIRAIGPSLPLPETLGDPVLNLHNSNGDVIASNNNWRDSQQQDIAATGIAPSQDLESAIVATLGPGAFTAVVAGNGGTSGGALVEFFDLSAEQGRLTNLSTRANVGVGDNVAIAGFVINGPEAKRVVIRGLGPSLRSSVAGALPDSSLSLHNAQGALFTSNAGWQNGPGDVASYGLAPSDPADSALVCELAPGHFTAILRSPAGATGIGLIEVFDVAP